MVAQSDNALMKIALASAWAYQGLTFPNPAVGAVLGNDNGDIISVGAHKMAGFPHAEVEVLKSAYIKLTGDKRLETIQNSADIHTFLSSHHNGIFSPFTLHVTLEPCHHHGKTPPCSQLIKTLGIKKVVIGSRDLSANAQGGGAFLESNGVKVVWDCLQEACDELLSPFLAWQNYQPFVFFKLALSKNGVASGGIITSEASRTMVHRLRDKCDLLVIGGNTVRTDKPLLDARLCDGKAPDVLIYSRQNDFDVSIPLFSVKNRKVLIENSLEKVEQYKMVMIEGGQEMLKSIENDINWYLIFQSPHLKEGNEITLPSHLREVFSQKIGEDTMTWYKKDA